MVAYSNPYVGPSPKINILFSCYWHGLTIVYTKTNKVFIKSKSELNESESNPIPYPQK